MANVVRCIRMQTTFNLFKFQQNRIKNSVPWLTKLCSRNYSDSKNDYRRNKTSTLIGVGLLGLGGLYLLRSRVIDAEAINEELMSDEYRKQVEDRNTKEIPRLNQRDKYNFIANVVERTTPAVVYIEIKDARRTDFYGIPLTLSNGSGFIIKEDGLILTNAHVVIGRPHSVVQVKLHDGRIFKGVIDNIDLKSDLATIRIPCANLPTLKLGSSASVKPGEWVVAVGSPLSLANTITAGVISSVNRGSTELGLHGKDMEYIQTDAAITFGNSGGPLINLDGEVVGINAMKVTTGISFAIPIDYAKDFLLTKESGTGLLGSWFGSKPETKSKDKTKLPKRRFLGVTLLTLTPQLILELQMRGTDLPPDVTNGVLIWKVVLGSPAHNGGLQPGDVIIAINGRKMIHSNDIFQVLEGTEEHLNISIIRKRQKLDLVISPEDSF